MVTQLSPKGGAQQPSTFMPMSVVSKRLDGLSNPAHQFLAHVCCGQTAEWIKMPLGTDVGLGPGNIVLDGDPSPHTERSTPDPPVFGPYL